MSDPLNEILNGPPGSTFQCEQPGCGRSVDTSEFGGSFIRLRAPSTPEREEDVESRLVCKACVPAVMQDGFNRKD